jgi:exodeoxyribonuclease V gamma subunit
LIRICTSHGTEVLLDAFVENLADERKRRGPFAPVEVVVPNRNVETYLRLGVCERSGIAANIETTFLRKFLASVAEKAVPGARVADVGHVEGHLLALLHDDGLLARPILAPVREYLVAAGTHRDAVDRRRCQLAAQLAKLFDEYASSRPDMLAAWAKGEDDARAGDEAEIRVWQRALWLEIFGPKGRLAKPARDIRYQSLETLWNEAMAQEPAPFAGQTLHVFGLSYIATAYHRMLAALARHSEVRIYTLSPCREDASTLSAPPDSSASDPHGLLKDTQLALRLWARPGRENLRLLARLDGASFDARFDARFDTKGGDHGALLCQVQDDIVERRTRETAAATEIIDGSLRVLPCPSLRRELEVVAAEIWSLVRKDPSLRLCDISVIVPEASKDLYLAQISTVFAESCELPHNIVDLSAANGHPAARAIELLVRLPFSSFSRKDFLPLLTHPCLMARFPEATPTAWRRLASDLGIVRGADRRDLENTYVERDLFTWEQGLRRLALGALIDTPEERVGPPLELGGESYLPGPAVASDDESSLGFGLLARSLIADARFASGPERPLSEWFTFVRGLVASYIVLDEEDDAGQAIVAKTLTALDDLADNGLGDLPVSYRIAAELALRAIAALPWSRGHYLSSGVTVATLVPMRAIPFRAVFVIGLGQHAFPRPARRPELDLRGLEREVGDVDRREQDLYMFLETLLSARDQVVLSYVARDEITGDELPASPVLLELRALLAQGYLRPAALARLFGDDKTTWPPLRRYDDSDERRAVLPAAESEHRAKQMASAPVPQATSPKPAPGSSRTRARKTSPKSSPASGPKVIPLSALYRFLQDPLQGSARFRLRMVEEDDSALVDVEDEPFDLDGLTKSRLVSATMPESILAAQGTPDWETVLATYERQSLALELAGQTPTGILRQATLRTEQALLRDWHGLLPQVLSASVADCRKIRLLAGDGPVPERSCNLVCLRAPGFRLRLAGSGESDDIDVRIAGETGLWARCSDALDTSLTFSSSRRIKKETRGREELRAFLEYVVITAAGARPEHHGHRSDLFFRDAKEKGDLRTLRFGPLSQERALTYLEELCADLLMGARNQDGAPTGVHPYLLPHEAVLSSHRNGSPVLDEIARLCENAQEPGGGFSSMRGPVRLAIDRYAAPTEEEAKRMVERRFGLFFALTSEERP